MARIRLATRRPPQPPRFVAAVPAQAPGERRARRRTPLLAPLALAPGKRRRTRFFLVLATNESAPQAHGASMARRRTPQPSRRFAPIWIILVYESAPQAHSASLLPTLMALLLGGRPFDWRPHGLLRLRRGLHPVGPGRLPLQEDGLPAALPLLRLLRRPEAPQDASPPPARQYSKPHPRRRPQAGDFPRIQGGSAELRPPCLDAIVLNWTMERNMMGWRLPFLNCIY